MVTGSLSIVVVPEDADLEQVFEVYGLSKGQRNYLSLRLRGMGRREAIEAADREFSSLRKAWEMDPVFKQAEGYILSKQEEYGSQALAAFVGNLDVKVQTLLDKLIDKGLEKWDEIEKPDKQCVMQAVSILAKRGNGKHRDEGDSYEEIILKKHIKTK